MSIPNVFQSFLPNPVQSYLRKLKRGIDRALFKPYVTSINICGDMYQIYVGEKTGIDWYVNVDWSSMAQMEHLLQLVSEGDTVLQVGAHHGVVALPIAKKLKSNGTVFCVEAHPLNYSIVKQNIQLNGFDNMEAAHLAIGDRKGIVEFMDVSNGSISNGNANMPKVKVDMCTLDDLGITPNLLSLDIEGFEVVALRHAKETMKNRPKLAIEVHPEEARQYGFNPNELWEYIPKDYEIFIQYDDKEGELQSLIHGTPFTQRVQIYAKPMTA